MATAQYNAEQVKLLQEKASQGDADAQITLGITKKQEGGGELHHITLDGSFIHILKFIRFHVCRWKWM